VTDDALIPASGDPEETNPEEDREDNDFDYSEWLSAYRVDDPTKTMQLPKSVFWLTMSPDEAERTWLDLNAWVNWLRLEYSIPAAEIPPYWHAHPLLRDWLTALWKHHEYAFHPGQEATSMIGWFNDFWDARKKLQEVVAQIGTRLTTDRPDRIYPWPGEDPAPEVRDVPITDRRRHFKQFIADDIATRRIIAEVEDEVRRDLGL